MSYYKRGSVFCMQVFKRSTAWLMVLCLLLGFALSVGPVAQKANAESYDPYVFYYGAEDVVPSYYKPSAKIYVGVSPHQILPDWIPGLNKTSPQYAMLFNLTNVNKVPQQKPAGFTEGSLIASYPALCVDLGVACVEGTRYRVINLEQGHFGADQDKVAHIRAIVRNAMYYLDDPSVVQDAANKYFGEETIEDLTGAQMASAIQAALWHHANDITYNAKDYISVAGGYKVAGPYMYSGESRSLMNNSVSLTDPIDADEWGDYYSTAKYNINNLYKYLINMPGESAVDPIITQNALSVESSILTGSGDDCTLTMLVDIDAVVNADDVLTLSATCGDQTEKIQLGKDGVSAVADGLFPITLTNVNRDDCSSVSLSLSGTQSVDDAVYYEAKPTATKNARQASQNYAGYGAKGIPVQAVKVVDALGDTSLDLTKVDEKSGNPLSGVSFDLYMKQDGDDLKIGNYVTDANGKISVTATAADDFYFVETGALKGYEAVTGSIAPGRVDRKSVV